METRKLYYEDCHRKEFDATVLDCAPVEKGWQIILDQTAFYPEGGGQACDGGFLAEAKVLDVREQGERVVHLCDSPLVPGTTVHGVLDWQGRFDRMQQHTGEHIVSGIINRRYGYHNVGFHMGADVVTIDFDGPIPPEVLGEIEEETNRILWQNLPVHCWYPAPEELPNIPYRSKKVLPWPVRIVQIPDCDTCACCGVHVERTGQIGLIKLFSCVKFHQGVRIEMACGGKALDILSRVYEQNRQVSQAFSAKILQTGEAARKMNEALAAEKYRSAGLEKRVFSGIAAGYRDKGDVVCFEDGLLPGGVRDLADAIAAVCAGTAAVFSGTDEDGYSVCLVNKNADVKELGKKMCEALRGRGGGKPGFFQGSVKASGEEIRRFFLEKPVVGELMQ